MSAYGLLVTAVPIVPAATKQYARPTSDISIVGWSPTPVYTRLLRPDDLILDALATANPNLPVGSVDNKILEVGLTSITDPNLDTGHTVSIRHKTNIQAGTGTWTGVAKLKQGTTVIASWTIFPDGSDVYKTDSYTLTSLEAAAITSYSTLRVNVTLSLTNDVDATATSGDASVTWVELQTPLPVIIVTSSADGIYESLQLVNQTSVDIYEALGGYSANNIELYELAGYAVATAAQPYESVGLLSAQNTENYEALTGLSQTNQAIYEALGIYSSNIIELYELVGFARASLDIQYEALGYLPVTVVANYEAVAALLQTAISNYESVATYLATQLDLYELLGYATGTGSVVYESLGYLAISAVAIYEAIATLLVTAIENYEALGFYSPTKIELYELLGYATGVASNPYDTEQTIINTAVDVFEALGFLIPSPQIPWEAEGTGYIVAQAYLYELIGYATGVVVNPYEALAAAIANAIVVWESEGTTYVLAKQYLYELIGFATALAQENYESSGPVTTTSVVPWEAEALAAVTQNVVVPFEALQYLLVNNNGVFESVSDVLSVLNEIIANYEALSIDQFEGDTFILNSVTTDEAGIDTGFTDEGAGVAIAGDCEVGTIVGFSQEIASPILTFPEQEYVTSFGGDKTTVNPAFTDETVVNPSFNTVTPIDETFTDVDASTDSNFTDS